MATKRIRCVIKPFKQDILIEKLRELGVDDVTVCEVRGFGRQKGHLELYTGTEYSISFLPKVKVEFSLPEERVEDMIRVVRDAVRTGRIGDGKIFIFDCDEVDV